MTSLKCPCLNSAFYHSFLGFLCSQYTTRAPKNQFINVKSYSIEGNEVYNKDQINELGE